MRAGNKINGSLRAKSPPRRLPEDTSTPLRRWSRYPPRALSAPRRAARDRSIPFLVPANKDARSRRARSESGTLARITRQLVTSLHSPTLSANARVPSLSEKSATFVISIRACAVLSESPGLTRKLPFLDLRARALFLYLGFYIR